jgi:uncharacterized SAM-binding protein YcdF (DUF218 family)
MTFAPHPPSRPVGLRTAHPRRQILLLVLLAIFLFGIAAFRGAGRWLVRPDALARADVIVILSGSMPYRAQQAASVYRSGYAPEIWITRPESPASTLQQMGIEYVGDEDYDRQVLLHSGVPSQAIRILPQTVLDTEQELTEVAAQLRAQRKSSAIVVTSPEHTRRVRALWRRLAGKNLKLIVSAAPQDPFDASHWWRTTRDVYSVCREYLGLLNAWLGLPVRPAAR